MTAVVENLPLDEVVLDTRCPVRRVSQVLDSGSVIGLHEPDDCGVYTARGYVDGSDTVVYCTDGTLMGGAMGALGCARIVEAIELALDIGCPIVGVWHSGGARLAEGVASLDAVGQVFAAMVRASGRVPQISVVVGPAAGGAAYGPALTDVVIMSPDGRVFVTGPDVVRAVTGEDVDQEGLGGAVTHGKFSGVVHIVADTEQDAYLRARRLVRLFAQRGVLDLTALHRGGDLGPLLPETTKRAYDMRPVVHSILDEFSFEELQAKWAPNIMVGLGRLAGQALGVIANNPLRKGGCLDSLAAEKAARFVRMCDSFGIPLLVLVDVPGYLPGLNQELGGVVRRGAKLLHAFGEAVVPRVTLVLRKSYGGAYIAMNSRCLGATKVFAWPGAEVAVMGAKAAVGILHRKKLAATPAGERWAVEEQMIADHEAVAGGVDRAMELRLVDEVIEPRHTRSRLAEALDAAPALRGRHGNIPL